MFDGLRVDGFGCNGNSIPTVSGRWMDLVSPRPEDVDSLDIAAGLSKLCRYGGQCAFFYSVAEHSVKALRLAQRDGVNMACQRAVLLHDAPEAYIGDVVKPLKNLLTDYRHVEYRIGVAVQQHFGICFDDHHREIKRYDRMMLRSEVEKFYPSQLSEFESLTGVESCDVAIEGWEPAYAAREFAKCCFELGLIEDGPLMAGVL